MTEIDLCSPPPPQHTNNPCMIYLLSLFSPEYFKLFYSFSLTFLMGWVLITALLPLITFKERVSGHIHIYT